MGGWTLFVVYRLIILKVFPSLFANSVWLIPFASNTSFIRFIHALILFNERKSTKFYLVTDEFLKEKLYLCTLKKKLE